MNSFTVNIAMAIATLAAFVGLGVGGGMIVGLLGGIIAIRMANAERSDR